MRVILENPYFLFVRLLSIKVNVNRKSKDRAKDEICLSEECQLSYEKIITE